MTKQRELEANGDHEPHEPKAGDPFSVEDIAKRRKVGPKRAERPVTTVRADGAKVAKGQAADRAKARAKARREKAVADAAGLALADA